MTDKQYNKGDLKLELSDYFFSREDFRLYENKEFGYLETRPQPDDLSFYYESEEYISHTDATKSRIEKLYAFVKNFNIRYKFAKLKNVQPGKKLLDYGCGTGDFLVFAQNQKLKVFGFEPNGFAFNIAQKKLNNSHVFNQPNEVFDQQYDVITLWHVLEHIPDLLAFVEELKTLLKPEGKIYIAVPNHLSFDAKFYRNYWAAYDVPRHLWHFSPESVHKLFNSFGMKIEKQFPLWFDSYYVSILSEKYKKTK